ncbi:MAG: TlpA disulfide reductase family protein [Treponema sp.]
MKKNLYHTFGFILVAVVCMSCFVKKAHANTTSKSKLSDLASYGFYVYEKPMDLVDFNLPSLDGAAAIKPESFTGKIGLLNFWATWCPPCRSEMPSIERLYKAMDKEKFIIAAINVGETQTTVAEFMQKNSYTFPTYLDEKNTIASILAARGIPITYVINKAGKVIAVRPGAMEYDQPKLMEIFKTLANADE